jgi:hypothetical protein
MPRIDRRRAGAILLQAIVMIMLLALIASAMIRCLFARALVVHRAQELDSGRQLARAAESQIYACLDGTSFGADRASCDVSAHRACLPSELDGHAVSVSASWSGGDCALSVSIER